MLHGRSVTSPTLRSVRHSSEWLGIALVNTANGVLEATTPSCKPCRFYVPDSLRSRRYGLGNNSSCRLRKSKLGHKLNTDPASLAPSPANNSKCVDHSNSPTQLPVDFR